MFRVFFTCNFVSIIILYLSFAATFPYSKKEKSLFHRYFSFSDKVFYPVAYIMNGLQHLTILISLKFYLASMLFIWPQLRVQRIHTSARIYEYKIDGRVIFLTWSSCRTSDNQKSDFTKYSIFSLKGESGKLQIFTGPNQILSDQNVTN